MIKTGALSTTLLLLALAAAPTARAGEPAELNCTPYTDLLDPAVDLELCQGAWLDDKDGLPIINMRDGEEYRWIVGQVTNNNAKMGVCKLSFDIAGTEKSHGFLMDPNTLPVGGKLGQLAPGELMTFSFLVPANDNGAVIVKLAKGLKSCIVDKKPKEEEEEEEPVETYVPKEVPQAESDYEEGGTDKDLPDPSADDGVEEREGGVIDTTPAVNTKDAVLVAVVENDNRALKVKTSGKVPGMKRRSDDDEDEEEEEDEDEEDEDAEEEDEDEEAEEDEDAEADADEDAEEEEETTTPVKKPAAAIKKPAAAAAAPATEEAADAAAEPAAAEPAPEAAAVPAARALRGVR